MSLPLIDFASRLAAAEAGANISFRVPPESMAQVQSVLPGLRRDGTVSNWRFRGSVLHVTRGNAPAIEESSQMAHLISGDMRSPALPLDQALSLSFFTELYAGVFNARPGERVEIPVTGSTAVLGMEMTRQGMIADRIAASFEYNAAAHMVVVVRGDNPCTLAEFVAFCRLSTV